nr:patatin-like phospholipase family protein [Bacteroidota bacterium]
MLDKIIYSFPVQLLINTLKRNPVLVFCWLVLFAIITGNFGRLMGVPFLFLDPEYLDTTDFLSFFIVGLTCGGFSMAFHISVYISECYKFTFLGSLSRPFTRFCLNNSIIPFTFLGWYIYEIILFHNLNENNDWFTLFLKIVGLCSGFILILSFLFAYFRFTNKDIIKILASKMDQKMRKVKMTRVNVMQRLDNVKKRKPKVKYYLDYNLKLKKVESITSFDKSEILKVFDQNHLNSIIIESFIFVIVFVLGIFRDNSYFQIPAAASLFLFLTILIMIAGALSFWLRKWALIAAVGFLICLNFLMKYDYISSEYKAYGMDYAKDPKSYSLEAIREGNMAIQVNKDKAATLEILKGWRAKFPENNKPKMILICTSGGGQRAALWTVKSLQVADSITKGALMKHTMLITGASGGLVGAGYFRELYLQKQLGHDIDLQDDKYPHNISKDVLNPIIFSLLVNDFFISFQSFKYSGFDYMKDRGYSFEQRLNFNTNSIMDKPLGAYALPERENKIPLLFLAPNIMN